MEELPSSLERFVNPYGDNAQEFTERYGAYFKPPQKYNDENIKRETKE